MSIGELRREKLADDYRDELRQNHFNDWKDTQDMRSLYAEYLSELSGADFHEIISYDNNFDDFVRELWENCDG